MDPDAPPVRPTWVKVSVVVALVLIALLALMLLLGGGNHGPGRHSGGNSNSEAQPSTAPQSPEGHQPPPGVDHGQP